MQKVTEIPEQVACLKRISRTILVCMPYKVALKHSEIAMGDVTQSTPFPDLSPERGVCILG